MVRTAGVLALMIALPFLAAAGAGGVVWENAGMAVQKAAATGKPICYYFTNNEVQRFGGG